MLLLNADYNLGILGIRPVDSLNKSGALLRFLCPPASPISLTHCPQRFCNLDGLPLCFDVCPLRTVVDDATPLITPSPQRLHNTVDMLSLLKAHGQLPRSRHAVPF